MSRDNWLHKDKPEIFCFKNRVLHICVRVSDTLVHLLEINVCMHITERESRISHYKLIVKITGAKTIGS